MPAAPSWSDRPRYEFSGHRRVEVDVPVDEHPVLEPEPVAGDRPLGDEPERARPRLRTPARVEQRPRPASRVGNAEPRVSDVVLQPEHEVGVDEVALRLEGALRAVPGERRDEGGRRSGRQRVGRAHDDDRDEQRSRDAPERERLPPRSARREHREDREAAERGEQRAARAGRNDRPEQHEQQHACRDTRPAFTTQQPLRCERDAERHHHRRRVRPAPESLVPRRELGRRRHHRAVVLHREQDEATERDEREAEQHAVDDERHRVRPPPRRPRQRAAGPEREHEEARVGAAEHRARRPEHREQSEPGEGGDGDHERRGRRTAPAPERERDGQRSEHEQGRPAQEARRLQPGEDRPGCENEHEDRCGSRRLDGALECEPAGDVRQSVRQDTLRP